MEVSCVNKVLFFFFWLSSFSNNRGHEKNCLHPRVCSRSQEGRLPLHLSPLPRALHFLQKVFGSAQELQRTRSGSNPRTSRRRRECLQQECKLYKELAVTG